MSVYDKYLGLEYDPGRQDCYSVVRAFLKDEYGVKLPNFARPTGFWDDPHLDLYGMYRQWGFYPVFDVPFQLGDILLMPLGTKVNSHAAIVVEGNQILHHVVGSLSCLDPLLPKWGRRANVVLRHPEVKPGGARVHLHEVLDADIFRDPEFQDALERAMEQHDRTLRNDLPDGGRVREPEPS